MQLSVAIATLAALPTVVLGVPLFDTNRGSKSSNSNPGNVGGLGDFSSGSPPSLTAIADARDNWRSDTRKVSQFLSNAETFGPAELESEAATALAAEKDELKHKAVLDREFRSDFNPDPSVQDAHDVLETQGKFQSVVDGLQRFRDKGATMSPRQVSAAVRAINQNRCTNVLPAIDTYMRAAGNVAEDGKVVRAVRPTNCPGNIAAGPNA